MVAGVGDLPLLEDRQDRAGEEGEGPEHQVDLVTHRLPRARARLVGVALFVADLEFDLPAADAARVVHRLDRRAGHRLDLRPPDFG
jgi:hypothetical protein